jgi:anthranilate synthase component II
LTIILIDNYDSFTYNLYQLISLESSQEVKVYRNDKIDIETITSLNPSYIILSPGPGHPKNLRDFGVCKDIIMTLSHNTPTLGVCLGHQGIGLLFGCKIKTANNILHGKTSTITHDQSDIFNHVPNQFKAARYHSLVIDKQTISNEIKILAISDDKEVMAVKHKKHPIFGIQFHPESILTEFGGQIIKNFIEISY